MRRSGCAAADGSLFTAALVRVSVVIVSGWPGGLHASCTRSPSVLHVWLLVCRVARVAEAWEWGGCRGASQRCRGAWRLFRACPEGVVTVSRPLAASGGAKA